MVKIEHDGQRFHCSNAQAQSIDFFKQTSSGFATVHGYVSESGRTKPETANINFISRFSVMELYRRKIAALNAMSFADVYDNARQNPKLNALDDAALETVFNTRKEKEIASCKKTLDGIRDDAHRQGHDRCYINLCEGVKVHLKTEKGNDGLKHPVLIDGLPVVETIMVNIIEIGRKVTEAGEYKVVNSGPDVLMSNVIASRLPRSCKIKSLSLREGNFDSLKVAGDEVLPDDIAGIFT